ncbi:MAG: sulfotransferase [Acidimicrobiia bacterium]|nr:sulfotransferase [Acidimicrobiia bacterium]
MRVLYLAGLGRNGSTIVSNVLGTVPGAFAVGELRSIWSHGFVTGALCGCGAVVSECLIWSEIARDHLDGVDEARAREIAALHGRLVKIRNVRALAAGRAPKGLDSDLREYLTVLQRLYAGIHAVTGCDVIVDASKAPAYGAILAMLDGIDYRTVHQVRDARASAHSWTRERAHTDLPGAMMPQYPPWKTALLWNLWNVGSEQLSAHPYLRVRYEDFAGRPQQTIRQLLEFAGMGERDADWTGERSVAIVGHHMIHGNPSRGKTGSIQLRPDSDWVDSFPKTTEALIAPLVLPLQLRYGYRWGGRYPPRRP